jgi:hypothetical protein
MVSLTKEDMTMSEKALAAKEIWVVGHNIEVPTTRRTKRGPQLSMRWVQGYHLVLDGRMTYPARTRKAAIAESASRGKTATFKDIGAWQ